VFVLPATAVRWRLRVFDLWGVLVRDFGGDDVGAGPRDLLWDGRDDAGTAVPAGGYVFALEVWSTADRVSGRERRLCTVRR
jgi:flagellar hook assembly protein FlgD